MAIIQTANFEDWVKEGTRRYRRIKAGFTLKPDWDRGHWTTGIVGQGTKAGTNMSIAAFTYLDWKRENEDPNYILTEAKMRNMSEAEAKAIYKEKYWDKVRGSEIQSQLIANFAADMKSSAGANGVKALQRALNAIGAVPELVEDGAFGNKTLAATNAAIQDGKEVQLNNEFRVQMIDFYKGLQNQASNWYTSLDRDYPHLYELPEPIAAVTGKKKLSAKEIIYIVVLIVILILGSFYLYKRFKK